MSFTDSPLVTLIFTGLVGTILITLIIITQSSPSLSGEPCIGWEENTENLVLGDCSSDIFIGYVKKTFSTNK